MDKLETGDLLIFKRKNENMFNVMGIVDYFSDNEIVHIGFVLRDPVWLNPSLKGTFVWESSWDSTPDPQEVGMRISTQITSLLDSRNRFPDCEIYVKKIKTPSPFFFKGLDKKFEKIHNRLFENPYSIIPNDWLRLSLGNSKENDMKYSKYWCSGLVAYIMRELGILYYSFDWSKVKPDDFSIESKKLKFCHRFSFEDTEIKLVI